VIDVSEVVDSADMAQDFTILRSSGFWQNGTWISQTTQINGHGVISVRPLTDTGQHRKSIASPRDIEMLPEGDVVKGAMVFWSSQPIYGTNVNSQGQAGSSDLLMWRGKQFRVLTVSQYSDYGYYRAVATRMDAA